ncbi:MAG: hypothetical protein Q8O99_00820 [bacterium]|nr:hypothetical protein [bacterium]
MLQGTPVGNKRLTKTTSMMEDLHTSFITSYGQRVQAYIQKVNQKEQQENYTDDLEKQLEGI